MLSKPLGVPGRTAGENRRAPWEFGRSHPRADGLQGHGMSPEAWAPSVTSGGRIPRSTRSTQVASRQSRLRRSRIHGQSRTGFPDSRITTQSTGTLPGAARASAELRSIQESTRGVGFGRPCVQLPPFRFQGAKGLQSLHDLALGLISGMDIQERGLSAESPGTGAGDQRLHLRLGHEIGVALDRMGEAGRGGCERHGPGRIRETFRSPTPQQTRRKRIASADTIHDVRDGIGELAVPGHGAQCARPARVSYRKPPSGGAVRRRSRAGSWRVSPVVGTGVNLLRHIDRRLRIGVSSARGGVLRRMPNISAASSRPPDQMRDPGQERLHLPRREVAR